MTAPVPVSTCPYPRDLDFIHREVMKEVMSRCRPGSRLALTGIGGVGQVQFLSRDYVLTCEIH
jgi:hypothetical protein